MPTSALVTFAAVLSSFRPHFTAPTFVRFVMLIVGWLLACDPSPCMCVTEALIAARVSDRLHWQAFHRFFSRTKWNPDRLGQTLFGLLRTLLAARWIEVAIDDTVCGKRGMHVFGASMHVDAVTSTRRRKNLVRGHCWVQLVVVVNVPWSKRPWAIPVLSRLYRGKKEAGADYCTKSKLGREMFDLFLTWVGPEVRVRLLLDSGYMGRTMLRGLPSERVTVFGAIKTNAALYRAPAPQGKGQRRGRRRKKGQRLPTPAKMHHDRRRAWDNVAIHAGARVQEKSILSLKAQWYGVLGERVNHVVLIREDEEKLRVVLCTDPNLGEQAIVEQGARRWPIEVWNRDVKQVFGFADSPAWSEQAVLRTAPWVALLSGILVVWFHRVYQRGMQVTLPQRPWYYWKEDLSFADLLRAAQETLRGVEVQTWTQAVVQQRPELFEGTTEKKNAVGYRRTEGLEKAKAA